MSKFSTKDQWEYLLKLMTADQLLALRKLFTEEQVAMFESKSDCAFPVEQLSRTAIVEVTCEGKQHLVDHTFADNYVAGFSFFW